MSYVIIDKPLIINDIIPFFSRTRASALSLTIDFNWFLMVVTETQNTVKYPTRAAIPKWGSADPWGSAKGLEGPAESFIICVIFVKLSFSALVNMKMKCRLRLNVENDLRVCLSQIVLFQGVQVFCS